MKHALVAALTLAATASAQTARRPEQIPDHIRKTRATPHPAAFTDPANLRGERVAPLTGRELPIDQGALGLGQLLRKLNTRASLMLIVAHPDDEDGGMLTYYSRGLGARVATLTLTRGEGGQNAVTGDFEDALGLIRTQELLSADRYFAADQFFGTEVDFGFSKTKQEAFAKWTHQRVLYDAVRAVRLYRPLVIAAVFIGGVTDGHGQHQVSGEIAQEVFNAAGDPKVFPELTAQGILPWQPLKVYARVPAFAISGKGLFDYATGQYAPARFTNYVTGETTTTPPTPDIIIHEGQTDPLLTYAAANLADLRTPPADPNTPLSYVQFARIGLGLQRTQIGPNIRVPPPGAVDIAYHLYGSRLCPVPNPHTPAAVILSEAKDLCIPPAAALPPASPNPLPPPKAHHITASEDTQTSQGPTQNPALTSQPSFFDGIDTSIEGIASLAPDARGNASALLKANLAGIQHSIAEAQADFSPHHPEACAQRLRDALVTTDALISNLDSLRPEALPISEKANVLHELRIKRVQLNDALVLAVGLHIDATTDSTTPQMQAAQPVSVNVHLATTASDSLPYQQVSVQNSVRDHYDILTNEDQTAAISRDKTATEPIELDADLARLVTRPYFWRPDIEQPFYNLRDPELRNAPATPPAVTAWADLQYQGTPLRIGRIVHAGSQPVTLVPPASVSLSNRAQVLPVNDGAGTVNLCVAPFDADVRTEMLRAPAHWKAQLARPTATPDGCFPYLVSQTEGGTGAATLQASVHLKDGQTLIEGFRPVGYPGIPLTNYFTPATDRVVPVELKVPTRRRIAYLAGTGDAVPEALASIGLPVTRLSIADLYPSRLAQFDTVILGVRTYNAHPDLHGAPTEALLDFARSGGNVVVQYQTFEFTAADAPYPLTLGTAEKVVDETAPVTLLQPNAALLTTPNRITPADFNGWIEERGHGFLHTWDPRYTALTETHDPGGPDTQPQVPQQGGLITVQLGRGRWTYCAFALYRQLPEAVPGAFRLFVNLITSR